MNSQQEKFQAACVKGDVDVVRLLLVDRRVNPAANWNHAIYVACENGRVEVVRLLLTDRRVNPTSAMYVACQNGHIDVVRLLLADNRVNPADNYNMTIRYACWNGHIDVVRLLLADARVNPGDDNNKAIRYACQRGYVDLVSLLLADPRVNPADFHNSAIQRACENGHVDVVRLLLADDRVNPTVDLILYACDDMTRILASDDMVRYLACPHHNYVERRTCENGDVDVICLLLMDSRIRIPGVVSLFPGIINKYSKVESISALLALARIEPFCTEWGPLVPSVHSLVMLRYWQRTLFKNLYKQDEEFRNGPYGVLLKRRLEIANLYGSVVLTSRLPEEMIELVLEYMR